VIFISSAQTSPASDPGGTRVANEKNGRASV
jgi:hypothetical protein